ncbi:hypothetical protein LZ30DRAFT_697144 [Colletotrichum cereale]|nr:hypothetical protein LZ30DRAFT_697144 [Colletotrichum cereale]
MPVSHPKLQAQPRKGLGTCRDPSVLTLRYGYNLGACPHLISCRFQFHLSLSPSLISSRYITTLTSDRVQVGVVAYPQIMYVLHYSVLWCICFCCCYHGRSLWNQTHALPHQQNLVCHIMRDDTRAESARLGGTSGAGNEGQKKGDETDPAGWLPAGWPAV